MRITVGNTDRVLRGLLAVGAVVGSAVLGFSTGGGIALLAVAAIMVLTAASGVCPIYSVLGIDTLGAGGHSDSAPHGIFHLHRAA